MGDIAGFLLAALALCGSPGPATLGLAATGAAFPLRTTWYFYAGLMTGAVFVMSIVASGIIAAVATVPWAAEGLTIIAISYICWLAWKIAHAPPVRQSGHEDEAPGFVTGMVLTFSNPKAYASFSAVFAGFDLLPGQAIASGALEMGILFVMISGINIAWLMAGNALQRFFHDERTSRLINVSFAVLLLASVAMAFII